ncbi:hypothetical protein J8273_7223 [Carpediemonas membranifera]|uniref:Uncharacterized protein n=1 Tax=Carpediemonas membranifera TaxID=201153 RepID=A0A8J6AS58_9EUKA|nr:hypothetical protein J8273_7223 [Carpediemonas membranifera]|eukprot:KAG9390950.1 hypothetical protein J8273_7223 [Carpediemonas membranifera]
MSTLLKEDDLADEQRQRMEALCDEIDPEIEDNGPMTAYPMPNEGFRPSIAQLQSLMEIEKKLDQSQYDSEAYTFLTAVNASVPATPKTSISSFLPGTSVSGSYYSKASASAATIPPPSSVLSAKLSASSLSTLQSVEKGIYRSSRAGSTEIDSTAAIMLAGQGSRRTVTGQRDYLREIRAQKALDNYSRTIDTLLDAIESDESILDAQQVRRAVLEAQTDPTILALLHGENPPTPRIPAESVEGEDAEGDADNDTPEPELEVPIVVPDIEVSATFGRLDGGSQTRLLELIKNLRVGGQATLKPDNAGVAETRSVSIPAVKPDGRPPSGAQKSTPRAVMPVPAVRPMSEGGTELPKPRKAERVKRVSSAGRETRLPPIEGR